VQIAWVVSEGVGLKTVGLIGFGSFGELVARLLDGKVTLKVTSRTMSKVPERLRATLPEVAACDYVVISLPLSSYREVLSQLAQHIGANTVVVDVCSVKVVPSRIIRELLPGNRLVVTHPLFGPQTAKEGLDTHVMVLCDDVSDGPELAAVEKLSRSLGLAVEHMSAEEHDRQMAYVHALTFFIARGLFGTDFDSITLKTPSFKRIESLVELERHHTADLFDTIEAGNPLASEVRRRFLQDLQQLSDVIDAQSELY
jgi:prephenate dehydrogenase